MPNNVDFQNEKEAILAIPEESVKTLNMPIGIFLQEAEDLYHWGLKDKEKLMGAGLPEAILDAIPVRAGACRHAQSEWNDEMSTREEAQNKWQVRFPSAYDLRDHLLHSYRYAFRNEPGILAVVDRIAEGYGHADMIQDLNDLAVLGKKHPDLLGAINFDMEKVDLAGTTSDDMADLLARSNGETLEGNEAKDIRDRAYTHLKEAVDQVRDCGKYVFWKDEKRLKGYRSSYFRKRHARSSKEVAQEVE
ncbi:MAG: hypothetical protein ACEPOZ_02995 [Marinifilaceae bacterium]